MSKQAIVYFKTCGNKKIFYSFLLFMLYSYFPVLIDNFQERTALCYFITFRGMNSRLLLDLDGERSIRSLHKLASRLRTEKNTEIA